MVYEIPDVDFPIPLLTIQPIVENAILHGIKPKVGGGTVSLKLEELPDHWQVTVTDDGVGFGWKLSERRAPSAGECAAAHSPLPRQRAADHQHSGHGHTGCPDLWKAGEKHGKSFKIDLKAYGFRTLHLVQ